jgi:NDP-sugar pyrophosphorylase family protein
VLSFVEKGDATGEGWISAGCYLVDRDIFATTEEVEAESLEREILPALVLDRRVYGYPTSGRFVDIGTPESYFLARTLLEELAQ